MTVSRLRLSLLSVAALVLAACGTPEGNAAFAKARTIARQPAQVERLVAGHTVKKWTRAHGTQIEYLAADGRSFLWYPGNRRVLPGRWKVQGIGRTAEMCFLYGSASRNPVTGQYGGRWECDSAAFYLVSRDEVVAGDPLRLTRRLPFVMPRTVDMSLAQAMDKAGLGDLDLPNVALHPRLPPTP